MGPSAQHGASTLRGHTARIALGEEDAAALGLVVLADTPGGLAEAAQRPEEAAVLLVGPADVAAAPPAVGPQPVEPTVVADAIAGVGLHVVPPEVAEAGPGVEVAGPAGDHGGHGVAPGTGVAGGQRRVEG